MASIGNNNQSSGVKSINHSDGSAYLLSDRLASLNFNGFIPRSNTSIYAPDLKVGQTIFNSDPSVQDNSFFITRIDPLPVVVEGVEETSYLLYFLGDSNIEEAYTYGAENEDGSFSQDHLFNSYRDDISNLSIGTDGWMITNQGNAIFSNVFVRGTVEATSGKIDGILNVGEDVNGDPLVTIGRNLFESTPFEGSSSEHSGIFLNRSNYFMGYDEVQSVPILSVVAEDSTTNVTLREAVFTLANHTLSVRDEVSIFGFAEDKFLELDKVFPVEEVTQNTFTVYYKNEIPGTTNPISVNLKVESFALDNIYDVTELNLVNVVSQEDTSTLKIYIDKQYTGLFEEDFSVTVNSFTSPVFGGNPNYLISSIVVTEGEDDPDYLLTSSLRATAGTYTTGLGQINSSLTNYKFKVGNDINSMSFNSFTGALSVTGTINADSGNFTNTVTIGKNNTSYSVYNKKLLGNVATLTTSIIHNFVIGDTVIVSGVDDTFNGTYVVTDVPTVESFSYNKTADPVASTPVSPLGTAAIGEAENGTLYVGYGTNQITINGTGDPLTSAIYAGAGAYGDVNTGFFMDASGRFSLKDKLTFSGNLSNPVLAVKGEITADTLDVGGEEGITYDGETVRIGTDVTIIGGVTATSFGIDANNYWNTTGNEGDFRVGNANAYMFWNKTGETTGILEVKGTINATAGIFSGNIQATGKIYSGSLDTGGLLTTGVEIASTGIKGIIGGVTAFNLPADGVTAPTITNFEILNAKITGDGSNAYLIAGNLSNNVTVRGDRTGVDATAAIFNTISSTPTTFAGGTGFYLNESGFFRVGSTTSNARFDPTANSGTGLFSVTGQITATSGTIGGFSIQETNLFSGTGATRVELNSSTGSISIGTGTVGASDTKMTLNKSGLTVSGLSNLIPTTLSIDPNTYGIKFQMGTSADYSNGGSFNILANDGYQLLKVISNQSPNSPNSPKLVSFLGSTFVLLSSYPNEPALLSLDSDLHVNGYSTLNQDVLMNNNLTVKRSLFIIEDTQSKAVVTNNLFLGGKTSNDNEMVSGCFISNDGYITVTRDSPSSTNPALQLQRFSVTTGNWQALKFRRTITSGVPASTGFINVANSTTTAPSFAAGSDYRLKENIRTADDDFINKISSLRLVRFDEIAVSENTNQLGFIAHEVQEIIPEAIEGEKDAVDENGDPDYQHIMQIKILPYLVGALQESIKKIEDLENRLAALES